MVVKKQTVKTATKKLRIVIEHSFGPFASVSELSATKRKVKSKVPKIVFTKPLKTSSGYVVKGRLSYVKSMSAPAQAVKQFLSERTPGAKVTVTKA